jgi:hypothetical protein
MNRTLAIVGGVLLLLVVAFYFLRRVASPAATGAPAASPPAPPAPPSPGGLVGTLTNIFANRTIGNAICSRYGGTKAACNAVATASQAVTAAQITVAKTTVVQTGKTIVGGATGTATAAKDLVTGDVSGAGKAAVAVSVAPIKAAASVGKSAVSAGKSAVHAISSIF